MELNQIVTILVFLSLGILLINIFKFNVAVGFAGALFSLALIFEFLYVIGQSDNPTMSNPLWIAIGAEILIGLAQFFGSLGVMVFGRKKK